MVIASAQILNSFPPHRFIVERSSRVEDCLHLFEGATFCLFQEDEDHNSHDDVETCVEEECVGAPCCDHVRRHEREEEVEEPLCGDAD